MLLLQQYFLQVNNILPENITTDKQLQSIARKVLDGERLSCEDGLVLYNCKNLLLLSWLATRQRKQLNGNKVFYNRNFHIEPTNICVNDCVFCSYRRNAGEPGSWDYSFDDLERLCLPYVDKPITEVHMVGGVHPEKDIYYYASLISKVKQVLPQVAVKAFTAVEIDYMSKKSGLSFSESLQLLKNSGLDAIPGGGAEIFAPAIRQQICPGKTDGITWLQIHEEAHKLGIPTNATMLFGHIEKPEHRIAHLQALRDLQDRTNGFDAFIPLKYKSQHNSLGVVGEIGSIEVLRNFAVCRLFLDNIPHLKAYWPMLGKDVMQLALLFGADDIDGTIDNSTKIYSMAGADEQQPTLTIEALQHYVCSAGFVPVERDTFYNEVVYS